MEVRSWLINLLVIISNCDNFYKTEFLTFYWSGAFKCALTAAMILEINLGRVIRPFPNNRKSIIRKIMHKRKPFKTLPRSGHLSKFPKISYFSMIRTEQTLFAWEGCQERLFSKSNMTAQLRFVKLHLNHKTTGRMSLDWQDQNGDVLP